MRLKDVKHEEEGRIKDFSFWSNRFYLFDKYGRKLDRYDMQTVENVLEIEVIEVKKSSYSGYSVGFPTTHIKLDFVNDGRILSDDFYFGDHDTRL